MKTWKVWREDSAMEVEAESLKVTQAGQACFETGGEIVMVVAASAYEAITPADDAGWGLGEPAAVPDVELGPPELPDEEGERDTLGEEEPPAGTEVELGLPEGSGVPVVTQAGTELDAGEAEPEDEDGLRDGLVADLRRLLADTVKAYAPEAILAGLGLTPLVLDAVEAGKSPAAWLEELRMGLIDALDGMEDTERVPWSELEAPAISIPRGMKPKAEPDPRGMASVPEPEGAGGGGPRRRLKDK